jgi:K+-sensing histidine kinase KdpD
MSRDEFASLVTHELRNPLNAMSGWLHLLSADPALRGDVAKRALAGLKRAMDQQLEQVDTLGRVLRLAGGEAPGVRDPIELGALLDACADALRPGAQAAGRDVVVERDGGAAWIAGDAAMLGQALRALGAFGLKHGVPGAALRLGVARAQDGAPRFDVAIDEGDDGGLSIWHGFGQGGTRLSLELLHAALAIEAHGARLGPRGDGRVGDVLEIRFEPSATISPGERSPARPGA